MYIKCWGARGSIPVSGTDYIKYGGDTTCIEIRTKNNDIIIIDAGTGIRRLGNQLLKEGLFNYNFLLTHAHWDHLLGFPFFKPLYKKGTNILLYQSPFPNKYLNIEEVITNLLSPPNFPVRYSDLSAKLEYYNSSSTSFKIGSVRVDSIALSHPNRGTGYKFTEDDKTFVFLTDNELDYRHPGGLLFDEYIEFCKGANLLIHDGEYTPDEYKITIEWGHSNYSSVLDLGIKAKVKRLGLFHLNQERTDREMDNIVESCRKNIQIQGIDIDCFAVAADMTFKI
ncbi:MAG: MBL fold metallo-hydrolase [Desulfobacterales bacterium]|nr:MBL fold metallo-hydrolase [Desulfobacterales bacterium]MBF0397184.1 MBL fold metallo-hydrolase [Desulfobacterales bacterium]